MIKRSHNPLSQKDGVSGIQPPDQHDAELARRTLQARGKLYELITQFRIDAASTPDPNGHLLFEFAAEILAGVARSFRDFDDEQGSRPRRDKLRMPP